MIASSKLKGHVWMLHSSCGAEQSSFMHHSKAIKASLVETTDLA